MTLSIITFVHSISDARGKMQSAGGLQNLIAHIWIIIFSFSTQSGLNSLK